MKPLSCLSQFIFLATKGGQKQFPGKQLSQKCYTLVLLRLFVAVAATVFQEPHFLRTKAQEHLRVTKFFQV